MDSPEAPLKLATESFTKAVEGIRGSHVEGMPDMAGRILDRIKGKELAFVPNNPTINIPTITGFDLLRVPTEGRLQYVPGIVVDVGKIIGAGQQMVQGDLARTLAIADQFPLNGFQKRYHEAYGDALDTQKAWLEQTDTQTILFDPRTTEREALLRNLLGDPRYFSDVGFEDWQKAIEIYKKMDPTDITVQSMLKQLQRSGEHFLSMRQRYLGENYQVALGQIGPGFVTEWTPDQRAEATAYVLLGNSLMRGPEDSN